MKADQLVLDRAEQTPERGAGTGSIVKTVLLHLQNDDTLGARIEAGLSIARSASAHLSCIHVTPFEAYVAFDNFGGVFVMNDVIKALDKEEEEVRARALAELDGEDVSWDYAQVTGSTARVIAGHAVLADLVVTGRSSHSRQFGGQAISTLGDLLYWARTPLFIPDDEGRAVDPTGTAIIAWDGSFQAANAVRASIGLLKLACDVRVVQIEEDTKEEAFPATGLLSYLSRHGIPAELQLERTRSQLDHQMITEMLLTHARAAKAAYMVLGAYSHSRIGEYVFGGVTRSLLAGSSVPVVLAR